jgi:hypothetical protein
VSVALVFTPARKTPRRPAWEGAQRRYLDQEVVFPDHQSRPDLGQELVLADDIALGRGERVQDVERPAADVQRLLVAGQLPPLQIEPKSPEPDLIAAGNHDGGRFHKF